MNDIYDVVKMLERSGLHVIGADNDSIFLEDPGCILRGFQSFIENAWIVLAVITGGLVMVWGLAMIRGSKNDIKNNFKTIVLILGILTVAGPILNTIYGGDLWGIGCRQISVKISQVNSLLDTHLKTSGDASLYEDINIYDSGAVYISESELPEPPDLSIIMDADFSESEGEETSAGLANE